ncbi:hypothetical protein ACFOU0_12355 [Salinicoccus sesuvii]|uniref:Hypervirulence associated protein TUDOR domain-containing protein n=1 Tax=Salinicoccus sesuvii TaxID=868281 RepID=A0ABV7N7U0_9STAP
MTYKVGDLIHITDWFGEKTDHVAEVVHVADEGGSIWFEPGVQTKLEENRGASNFLAKSCSFACDIEKA